MSKEKRLGRGLEALLGKVAAAQNADGAGFAGASGSSGFSASAAASLTSVPISPVSSGAGAGAAGAAAISGSSAPSVLPGVSGSTSTAARTVGADGGRADQSVKTLKIVQTDETDASAPSQSAARTSQPAARTTSQVAPGTPTPSVTRSVADFLEDERDRVVDEFSVGKTASEIPLDRVDRNPFQPRLDFDETELAELASSIARHGMIQPIVVRRKGERFEIVAGERRYRAAKQAGWKNVPAHLLEVDDRQMAEMALTENVQRRDLNPIEKALAFRNYLDLYGGTHEELAKRLDLDRSTVTNLTRLLDLPDEIQTQVRRGDLTQGHARALLPLEEWDQLELARRIVEEKLSVRQTETIVREFLDGSGLLPPKQQPPKAPEQSPRVRDLEQQFRTWLGMKVKLTSNDKGKGKLVVQFNSNDEFERVYQALKPREF